MSFTGIFGLVLLGILAVSLLGPSKLPQGLEQLWLMLANFRRSQTDVPPLSLEEARRVWKASENPLYDLIQILYGAVEHLVELRRRIFYVLGALLVGAIVAGIFASRLLKLLTIPAKGVQLIVLRPTDMVWTYMEVIFSAAAVVALPVLLYQALLFIRPALETPQEISVFRSIAIVGTPLVAFFFMLGITFAYFIMLPFGLKYLQSFGSELATANWNIREYFSFVLAVLLWIGAAFETPLIMALLARLGLVSPKAMIRQWRYAIVGIAFVAAAITPTVDPVNMALVMGPLVGLYFLGVIMARAVYKPRVSSRYPLNL
ncbi:MAG: twin-arginine translocase subunit TatC [Chloroflexi bacterium HGW-Chloroflexi-1]|nr:MAG: twin-arginine translocase subunit TatC [Chloroflexi bacterium HGW-Chloroflexi-1]